MPAPLSQPQLQEALPEDLPDDVYIYAEAELELRRRKKLQEDGLESKRAEWREHPVRYAYEVFGVILTPDQEKIFRSIRDNRRTLVKASHAIGKTYLIAIALNWWFDCWWGGHIAYITAPTWTSALGLTFKYTKKFRLDAGLSNAEILNSGWIRNWDQRLQTTHYIRTLNAESGEGFQGEHSADILVVFEEAVGVPGYIWESSDGLMTAPGCRIVAIGNPTDEATKFGEMSDSPQWEVFSVSALDHPNISAELYCQEVPYPGAIRLMWLYEMLDRECDQVPKGTENAFEFYSKEDVLKALNGTPIDDSIKKVWFKPTAFFQGRVLGDFPTEASDKVIPAGWLKHLPTEEIPEYTLDLARQLELGCDVARFGDDRTTIFTRVKNIVLTGSEIRNFDSDKIVGAIIDAIDQAIKALNLIPTDALRKQVSIKIDITGGLGTGPYDILKSRGYNVIGINSAERAKDAALYKNKRSELWFNLADRVKEKNIDISRLTPDLRKRLKKELSTPHYAVKGGKKIVEEKTDIKKRLGSSPDLADGFNLTFYENQYFSGTTISKFAR